jgi:peroxiredoxin Q/BCP
MLKENITAPDFSLPDENNTLHALSDYAGEWVLLYFYPKDDTPGCTKEACTFRDNLPNFEKLNVRVLGISADSPQSHVAFKDKYDLNFTLLSDTKKEVIKMYDAGGAFTRRISYLIDPKGIIKKAYSKVVPAEHPEQVLNDIRAL